MHTTATNVKQILLNTTSVRLNHSSQGNNYLNHTTFSGFSDGNLRTYSAVLEAMNKYVIPIIVLVGLFGNGLSLMVFLGTYMRQMSLSVYLSALAIADSGCLITIFITWLDVVDVTIFHMPGVCQITVYMTYVCSFLSVWYVLSFTVERYIAVTFPFKRPVMCTVYRAKIVTLSLSVIALLGYSGTLFANGVRRVQSYDLCVPYVEYIGFISVLTYVDTMVALLIPFLVILALNCKIAHKVAYFYSKKRHAQFAFPNSVVTNRHGGLSTSTLSNRAQISVTKLMLTISTVFLVINLPSYVVRIRLFIISFTVNNYHAGIDELLWQSLVQFVYYINFSINFFIYSLCCRKFRGALRRLIWKIRYKISLFSERYLIFGRNSSDSQNNIQVLD